MWHVNSLIFIVREKSGFLNRLSELKSFTLPYRFNLMISVSPKNGISKSQGNFSEVREKSGKMQVEKSGHLGAEILKIFSYTLAILSLMAETEGWENN